jgi:hypothetical protein
MLALLKNTLKKLGTPRFIVTVHGCQFCANSSEPRKN